MLTRLYVKNVALIDEADIEFDGGLNVLSGETGSGKSVILDSINFVLGSKADRTMIRHGENEAMVRAEFFVDKSEEAAKKLEDCDIETDGTIIISRKITLDGKSAIKINGNAVTASMLKNITQHLVDVHGQSEHFFLLSEENQLKVVDTLAGKQAEKIKTELAENISAKRKLKNAVTDLGGDESERERKIDLLGFQISEIEGAELKDGEYESLKSRRNVLMNIEKIISSINAVQSIFNDDGGCGDSITSAVHIFNQISQIGEEYAQVCSRLESLSEEISDISQTLTDLSDNLSFDENEINSVEERLAILNNLRKKYGNTEVEILAFLEKAKCDYSAISHSASLIEKYTQEISEYEDRIYKLCTELSDLRKEVSGKFCANVEKELITLNIPDAKFGVKFKKYDRQTANLSSVNGSDEISFEFSANKGEPLKPLNKVISGGEMSRFMLAVKTQLKDLNGISTYIFDEIDAGISGFTASTVARKFISIAKNTQILAVSHLPQVCAASNMQFLIYKEERGNKTVTKVKKLNEEQKIAEIVRLTGGNLNSDAAKINAKELIAQFKN